MSRETNVNQDVGNIILPPSSMPLVWIVTLDDFCKHTTMINIETNFSARDFHKALKREGYEVSEPSYTVIGLPRIEQIASNTADVEILKFYSFMLYPFQGSDNRAVYQLSDSCRRSNKPLDEAIGNYAFHYPPARLCITDNRHLRELVNSLTRHAVFSKLLYKNPE
ncbi:hypothetical protein HQ545_06245 [Candidatus Woesearchaeota archaeon]|nr:hypothetical protein [Candidatus Woesearchaeota archaeon]